MSCRKRVYHSVLGVLLLLAPIVLLGCRDEKEPGTCIEKKYYVLSYFEGTGASGVYLAYSDEGLNWTELNGGKPFVKATIGGAFTWGHTNDSMVTRDPCIIRGPDGIFHMVFTAFVKPLGFGYTSSKDLIHWSEQKAVRVMADEPNAENCWAPDLFYDDAKKEYLILWSTTVPGKYPETDGQSNAGPPAPGHNHRIYYCTTKEFKTFSESKLLYNDDFNVIDATIVKDTNRYVMFLKDETNKPFVPQKKIRMAFAENAEGPYGPASKPITGDYWCEGPSAIKIGNNWYVYFDKYRKGSYGVVTSKDLNHWEDISDKASFPGSCSHGTAFEVPKDILDNLLKLR